MTYVFEIIIVIMCCGGCFMWYGECCSEECSSYDSETTDKPDNDFVIPETSSPIQKNHIEL
jgi:hypothetical protein